MTHPHGKREAERIEPRDIERTQAETISLVRSVVVRAGWDLPFLDDAADALRCERDDLLTKNVELHAEIVSLRAENDLLTHKIITCGVAASHPDVALSSRGKDYGGPWDSPQAQAVRTLRDAHREAIAQVNKLVAETARLMGENEELRRQNETLLDAELRIAEPEACLRGAPCCDCIKVQDWCERRDAMPAGPPANVIQTVGDIDMVEERHTVSADDDTCPGCGVVWSCVCPAPDEVDPAPPAEAERPSDHEVKCIAEFLDGMDADIPAERVRRLLACVAKLESKLDDAASDAAHYKETNAVLHARTRELDALLEAAEAALVSQDKSSAAEVRSVIPGIAAVVAERDQLREQLSTRAEEGERRTYWLIEGYPLQPDYTQPVRWEYPTEEGARNATAIYGIPAIRVTEIRTLLTPSEGGK